MKRKKVLQILSVVAAIITFLAIAAITSSFIFVKSLESKMRPVPKEDKKIARVVAKSISGEPYYILMIGSDKRPEERDISPDKPRNRSDTIMILRVDPKKRKFHIISIPRDTRVKIKGYGFTKINHSIPIGGIPLLIETVQDFTGLPINYYFLLDFESFSEMVDAVGGIYYNVDSTWKRGKHDPLLPSGQGWIDDLSNATVRPGFLKRDGKEILGLLRVRSFGSGDFTRIEHQHEFLRELVKQLLKSYKDIPKLTMIAASHARTNMGLEKMLELGRLFMDSGKKFQAATIPGRPGRLHGVSYVLPYEEEKKKLVELMKEGKDFP